MWVAIIFRVFPFSNVVSRGGVGVVTWIDRTSMVDDNGCTTINVDAAFVLVGHGRRHRGGGGG